MTKLPKCLKEQLKEFNAHESLEFHEPEAGFNEGLVCAFETLKTHGWREIEAMSEMRFVKTQKELENYMMSKGWHSPDMLARKTQQLKVKICDEFDLDYGICTSGKGMKIEQCIICKFIDEVFENKK
jgi:hypothetical protein